MWCHGVAAGTCHVNTAADAFLWEPLSVLLVQVRAAAAEAGGGRGDLR
jgi:hypothetical protein